MASKEAKNDETIGLVRSTVKESQMLADNVHVIPDSPYNSQQKKLLFDFNSPAISAVNTSIQPSLHCELKEKSCLCVPKMAMRNRLTSTPNTAGIYGSPKAKSILDDDLNDLSPTGAYPYDNLSKFQSCLDKTMLVDDLKGVLFPPHESHTGQCASLQPHINLDKSMLINDNMSILKTHHSRNLGASFQDSGFDSLGTSVISQDSVINSPVKRKANNNITSVESPMKKLAFEPPPYHKRATTDLDERNVKYDTSLPGCSFFMNSEGKFEDPLQSPVTPIFANTIQFSPHAAFKTKLDNNMFTKPLQVPPRQRIIKDPAATVDCNLQFKKTSHAGKAYFDIISHLAKSDLSHVVTKIFRTMRPKDIFRCSHVSSSWAAICKSNTFLRRKIKALKRQYHEDELAYGSENVTVSEAIKNALLKSPTKAESQRDLSSGRSTLGSLQARAKRTPTKGSSIVMPKTPSGKNHFVPAENKFQHNQAVKRSLEFGETLRPCPKCGWTAKIYGDGTNKGLCYRYKCKFTFCTICKSSYHFPVQCSPPRLSPTFKSDAAKEPKIGTKKSRERLKKRLLM